MLPFSRFEARTILKLSGPIVLAQLTQTLMYFVDTVMAGRYSAVDMAAIAVASGLWFPVVMTLQGLLLALTPIVAQFYGSKQTVKVFSYTVLPVLFVVSVARNQRHSDGGFRPHHLLVYGIYFTPAASLFQG